MVKAKEESEEDDEDDDEEDDEDDDEEEEGEFHNRDLTYSVSGGLRMRNVYSMLQNPPFLAIHAVAQYFCVECTEVEQSQCYVFGTSVCYRLLVLSSIAGTLTICLHNVSA